MITSQLAEFVATLKPADLSAPLVDRTKLLLLDCIGNIIRARMEAESTPALLRAVKALGLDVGKAKVFGDKQSYSPAGAVLINATLAHSLDFDDTHAAAIVHAAAPVIPAALAAAEMVNANGADLLAAIVAGYEVALRLALALPAGAHYERGFHPSATCGVFGAAAAAARIFDLDAEKVANAFGIALSQSAGSLQFLANGAWTKRFQVGWAGMAGFVAATLAREGFIGAAEPLEGRHGFLRIYAPAPVPERVVQDLGSVWETMNMGVKPYPSCRWAHAGVDAALALRAEHNLKAQDIESVTLGISKAGMLLVGEPAAKKANPQNIVDAQFSGPFVIANALLYGQMGWDSYKHLGDSDLVSMIQRIRCENDPEIEAEFPANMSGKITLQAGGRTYTKTVIIPKGDPDNFPSPAVLQEKFTSLASPGIGMAATERLAKVILECDHLNEAAALFSTASVE